MTDLHNRFRKLDDLQAPDLWREIEGRALAAEPRPVRSLSWTLVVAMLLLTLALSGAILIGSGIIKLPVQVDASAAPSSTANESVAASATPVQPVPASWTATGNMIEARTGHTATRLLDGRVLVAGGVGLATSEFFANILASAELYDPDTGQWAATGAMAGVRVGHTATLLSDGRVLVAGGSSSSDGDGGPLASAELYDPDTETWTTTASMLEVRSGGHTATLLTDGSILVAGGISPFDPIASAELYDPVTESWSSAGGMVQGRADHTATLLLDGTVLMAGSAVDLASAELYDSSTRRWTATGRMIEGRTFHTAALLADGWVLVTGSMNGSGASSSAELYDPGNGRWTATGSMIESRLNHTVTPLPDGRVLVTGGVDSVIDGGVARTSAELYDPGTRSWTATVGMADARIGYTATLLRDGTVLVAGGSDNGVALASAELYDPGSGT